MEKLITGLGEIFSDDHVNTEDVFKLLRSYKSNPKDWRKFAQFDPHKYTRNLVDIGNGKYNLIVLCWGPGMGSSIHDHTDSHCFVKMLDGQLLETQFEFPKPGQENEPLRKMSEQLYEKDGVTYINDQIGLHRMENPSYIDGAVSLHLYIPAYESCEIFDEKTGRHTKSAVTFYTKFGHKVDYHGTKTGNLVYPSLLARPLDVARSPFSPV